MNEVLSESFATLTLNKLRTGLAMLGIIIGIASVITLLSLGQATQQQVQSQIQSLGANLLTVSPAAQNSGGVRGAAGSSDSLTLADAEAIEESSEITTIAYVSPELSSQAQVSTPQQNTNVQIIGVTSMYQPVHNIEIQQGSFISEYDNTSMRKVAVLGSQVVTDLFGEGVDSIGKTIRINGQSLTVIGTTVSKGGTGFMNQDNLVYVPLSTAQRQLFGINALSSIALAAKSAEVMTEAQNQVGYFLLSRHKITDPTEADFSIFSQADILSAASATTGTFTTLLSGIAAISLLVGGIGVMNIMLVNVTERTREIGLRKALGAKKKTITSQFLLESVILTFVGGIFGMLLGILTSFVIAQVVNYPFVVSAPAIFLALIVSSGIGILFGWYPAKRAASLQPIEALRYE